jgi:hypothetical protein
MYAFAAFIALAVGLSPRGVCTYSRGSLAEPNRTIQKLILRGVP